MARIVVQEKSSLSKTYRHKMRHDNKSRNPPSMISAVNMHQITTQKTRDRVAISPLSVNAIFVLNNADQKAAVTVRESYGEPN
jgi:hypothetical protein